MERGRKVYIDKECRETRTAYGMNHEMRKLRGTIQTIEEVYGVTVYLLGYSWKWHISDINPPKDPIKIPVQTFDPSNLNLPE